MNISVPYNKSSMEFELAEKYLVGVFSSTLPHADLAESYCVKNALDNPIASLRLEELARGKKTALIIASDHTRPVPSKIIVPQMLERIRRFVPDIKITILVATGVHRSTTRDELVAKFGEYIVDNENIVIHDSSDNSTLIEAGVLPSGGKFIVNRLVMEADLVVSEGFIEPHFFAGFSGGRKSILPGVVSRETVLANHCSEFIQSPFARTGILDGNPIHNDMIYAAQTAKLAFVVNVIIDHKKQIIYTVAGDAIEAHRSGCDYLKQICQVNVPESDIVITSNGGYPLDQNVYQAVKGMTAAESVCREGGVIIMVAACSDGHGGDSFYENLSKYSPDVLLQKIANVPRNQTQVDQWEFQILARILVKHTVIMVTTDCDHNVLHNMHLKTAFSIDEALLMAREIIGDNAKISVIPDGVSVIANKTKI